MDNKVTKNEFLKQVGAKRNLTLPELGKENHGNRI